jgi:hypothetical protein
MKHQIIPQHSGTRHLVRSIAQRALVGRFDHWHDPGDVGDFRHSGRQGALPRLNFGRRASLEFIQPPLGLPG